MTALAQRRQVMGLVADATAAGARQDRACAAICLSERTLQRWQRDESQGDRRPARVQAPGNTLSALERQALLAVANSEEFGHLAPSQIVPRLADRGQYIASESTFYRVLRAQSQLQHRGAERPKQPRSKPRALRATAPRQLFSWDITLYLMGVAIRYRRTRRGQPGHHVRPRACNVDVAPRLTFAPYTDRTVAKAAHAATSLH